MIYVACKTCPVCKAIQPHKQRLVGERKRFVEDGKAYKARVKKHCNSSHVVDSSFKMLDRLAALGYFPLLLLGKKNKSSYTAQVFGSMQMQLDPSLQEDLQSVYAKVLKYMEFVVLDLVPYEDGNYDVAGQDDQGTQSGDGVGMEREQEMVPEEGAGTQSSDVVGMEREQEGRKENKDEKMVKSRRKRKHQTESRAKGSARNPVEPLWSVRVGERCGPILTACGLFVKFFFSGFPARNGFQDLQEIEGKEGNPLPFLHDDITEQMDVRHHVLLNLLLDDAPQVLQHDNCLAEEVVGGFSHNSLCKFKLLHCAQRQLDGRTGSFWCYRPHHLSPKRPHFTPQIAIVTCTLINLLLFKNDTVSVIDPPIPPEYLEDLPGCLAIIKGDLDGATYNLDRLRRSSTTGLETLPGNWYPKVAEDCTAYITRRGFITVPLSAEEQDFPIAYSMVIHEKVGMFERLLRALYRPQNIYCVHVDKKSSRDFLDNVTAIVSCFPNVFIASKLESVVYASWSRVQADLNCMEDLLRSPVPWRYLLNTCGSDFPIKTNGEMVRALRALNGRNSIESEATEDHKRDRWRYRHEVNDQGMVVRTGVEKSPPPISTPMYQGNAYFVVTREFVRHVTGDQDQGIRAFLGWEADTYSPDEHLWATLQRMPSVPGSTPPNPKYDESDMRALARLVKWGYLEGDVARGAPYPPCRGAHRRSVCLYGVGDLPWLFRQQHLMANKFDPEVDDVSIRCIEAYLHVKARWRQFGANGDGHAALL
ncbi:Beta-1,3-galactosyl-O-glycosyl-glycoprotein beta-1,6-N-acetylglucosaminyltransferase [Merluccius polli]|uniref:Beta-1,3-galactosyl-O-glycosyl-glycoprotein beta-1,6-N-acetylglucosaminyltransferase 3 n=1 Tax=Merluccius polli TaxID=89951 RepID=A0AA47MTV8_MERPO|nr:Beta-1,3-galactosyl-O-glycosyl-glycoprotein beta-1,6-N-acetylglucosaminyltransferase [Merluccius polli]